MFHPAWCLFPTDFKEKWWHKRLQRSLSRIIWLLCVKAYSRTSPFPKLYSISKRNVSHLDVPPCQLNVKFGRIKERKRKSRTILLFISYMTIIKMIIVSVPLPAKYTKEAVLEQALCLHCLSLLLFYKYNIGVVHIIF